MMTHGKLKKNEKPETDNQNNLYREIQIEFLIHELKDPIAVIDSGARLLLENRDKCGSLTARQEKALQRILRGAKKAGAMLHDILETGRSMAGCINCCRFKPAEALYDVLIDSMETILSGFLYEQKRKSECGDELVGLLAEEGISVNIDQGIIGEEIEQDEIKFRQIAGNLFKNALYYRAGKMEIKLNRKDDFFILDVSDDGPGIEPEDYQNVFERYVKIESNTGVSRKGHGIGLSGALVMARSVGGDIEIESRRGKGARFRLIFPVSMKKI